MTPDAIKLIPDGEPDEKGRQYYKPVVVKITGKSQYNANQFSLEGIRGFWEWSREPALELGRKYRLGLATKPKIGPGAKPGAVYMDIVSIDPVFDADGAEYVDVGTDAGPNPDSLPVDHKDTEPPPKRSPLAGVSIPAEWSMASEYWVWNRQTERASIEKQVLWKINAERQIAGARMRTDLAIAAMGAKAAMFDKQYVTTLFADAQKAISDLLFEQATIRTEQVKDAVEQAEKPGEDESERAPW